MTSFGGSGALLRLALRRDRFVMPIWVLLLGSFAAIYYTQFAKLYPTQADRELLVLTTKANPAWVALAGPLSSSETGALALWKSSIGIIILALATMLTVIRHGRADEETGRRELLESTPIGRLAHPCAALSIATIAALATGLVQSLTLIAVKAAPASSLLSGAALALTGIVFALIASVIGQLTQSARGARLLSGGALAVAFMLRASGDVGASSGRGWLSWLSPLGWANAVQAFGANKWWVLALPATLALLLTPVTFTLDRRRDIGSGVVQPRAGRAAARPALRSSFALAWRLQRTTLFAWLLMFIAVGYVLGSSSKALHDLLHSTPKLTVWLERIGGVGAVTDIYFAVVISMMGLFAAAFAIQASLRLHSEEEAGRAEPILAAAVSRWRWAMSHVVIALAGSAFLLAVVGLVSGLSEDSKVQSRTHAMWSLLGASLVQVPAVWLMIAIALLIFGFIPKWSMAAWGAYALVFIAGIVIPAAWPTSKLADLSPFTHVPKLPSAPMSWAPVLWLSAAALVLTVVALAAFRRRDLR